MHVLPELGEIVAAELLNPVVLLVRAHSELSQVRNLLQPRMMWVEHEALVLQVFLVLQVSPVL